MPFKSVKVVTANEGRSKRLGSPRQGPKTDAEAEFRALGPGGVWVRVNSPRGGPGASVRGSGPALKEGADRLNGPHDHHGGLGEGRLTSTSTAGRRSRCLGPRLVRPSPAPSAPSHSAPLVAP